MSVLSGNSNTNLSTILYGTNKTVQEVYLGNALVWSAQSTSFSFNPPTLYNLSNDGGSVDITFTPGVSDYVAGTWPAWVSSVTPTVVSGVTTKITVAYNENASTSTRDGNLTFFAGGENRTVPMSQQATSTVSVTGVSLNKTSTTITAGSTEQLVATITPSNATNQNVTWSSSNTSVATVSSSGLVTAVAAGSATITVRTNDGNYTATCTAAVTSASFSVQPTQLEFEHNESTYVSYREVAITTAQSWTASITSGFTIHNNVTSGTGNKTLYIYPSNVNNNTTAKTGTLTITPNVGTAVTVQLTQKAYTYFNISPTTISFDQDAYGSQAREAIVISSNQSWSAVASSGFAIYGSASGTNNGTIYVYPQSYNPGVNTKTGTVTITPSSGSAVTVQLSQAGLSVVSLSETQLNVSASSGTYSLTVYDSDNVGWLIESNQTWCTVSPSNGYGDTTLTVSVGQYTGTSSNRTATITLTPASGSAVTCTVTQAKATAVSVSPSSITFDASGSTETITITGTFSEWWIGENDCPSWCTPSGMSGNTSTISVTTSGNTSGSTRTGSIVVNVDGTDYTISVSQEPVSTVIPVTGVSVSPSTLSLVAGKTSTLTATVSPSNATDKSVTWSSSNTSVASVNEYGVVSAVGAGSVTITATSNYDSTKTGSCTLTVAAATLTVSPTSMSFSSGEGTSTYGKDLTITANGNWNMNLSGSGFTTDQGTSYSGSGNAVISVYPTTMNTSSSSRSATITVTAYGPLSRTVSVTQSGVETLDVTYNGSTATSLTFAATDNTQAEGKTLYITTANQGWTATVSSGFSLTTNSGVAGPSALGVYPSSVNTGSTNKTGTLTIQGTVSGTVSVSLTQTPLVFEIIGETDPPIGETFGYIVDPLIPVNWSVTSGSSKCSTSTSGNYFYVTPNENAQVGDTIVIRATSTEINTRYAELTLTVAEGAVVGPESITVSGSDTIYTTTNKGTYTATIVPAGSGEVVWSVAGADASKCTIAGSGTYTTSQDGTSDITTATVTVKPNANYLCEARVVATSVDNSSVYGSITIYFTYRS